MSAIVGPPLRRVVRRQAYATLRPPAYAYTVPIKFRPTQGSCVHDYGRVSLFTDAAKEAFAPLALAYRLTVADVFDNEWSAAVRWRNERVHLAVEDDRRDMYTSVVVSRLATAEEVREATEGEDLLFSGGHITVPLWAVAALRGTELQTTASGSERERIQDLPALATATSASASHFLSATGPNWAPSAR